MTRVLVVASSRHGATTDIARSIGEQLEQHGVHAVVATTDELPATVDGYDAYVVGSAVYTGHWTKQARRFVADHRDALTSAPLWLFSSGPVGHIATGPDEPAEVATYVASLGARDHRVFAGKIDPAQLHLHERLAVRFVHAPTGDFRDWREIEAWADSIAATLRGVAAPAAQ